MVLAVLRDSGAVADQAPSQRAQFSPLLVSGGERKANKRKLNFGHVKKDNTQEQEYRERNFKRFSSHRHLNNIFSETFATIALKTKPLHKEGVRQGGLGHIPVIAT